MAVPLETFKPVLQAFLDPKDEVRNAAEKALRDLLATSADQLAASLLQVCLMGCVCYLRLWLVVCCLWFKRVSMVAWLCEWDVGGMV